MATNPNDRKIKKFINKLVGLKHEAGELGLFGTMHELDKAVKKIGFEFALIIKETKLNKEAGK